MSPYMSVLYVSIVFEEYEKIANKSIEDSIKSETHGSLEEAMLTVGKKIGFWHLSIHSPRRSQQVTGSLYPKDTPPAQCSQPGS